MLFTCHPILNLPRTVRPGKCKGTGTGKDMDRASEMSLVRMLTQLASSPDTWAPLTHGQTVSEDQQLAWS